MGHSRPLFLYFRLFGTVENDYMNKSSPMTGFEPRTSGKYEATALPTEPQPLPNNVYSFGPRLTAPFIPRDKG